MPILALVVAGCCPPPTRSELAAAVNAQCAPVSDLLSKNVTRTGQLRVAGFGGGGEYSTQGAILDSAAAKQTYDLNAACRAWVAGAMTDDRYADLLVAQMGAAISLSTRPEDQAVAITEVLTALADLKHGLPSGLPLEPALRREVAKANDTPAQQIRTQLAVPDAAPVADTESLSLIAARLDYLEQLIQAERGGSGPDNAPGNDVVPRTNGFDVYFATGSPELTFDAAAEVRRRGDAFRTRRVEVIGYADARGSAETNARLSLARARAVADILTQSGVIVVSSSGAGATSNLPAEYSRARRVTIRVAAAAAGG